MSKFTLKNFQPTSYAKRMRRTQNIHLIGIGGIGMSGIAEILLNQNYNVFGSDLHESPITKRLEELGAKIFRGHDAKNITQADVVVISSAVQPANVELIEAKNRHIPIISRASMLAELMRFHCGVALTGTHGKTTTTSLVVSILAEAGLDPTFAIGGRLNSVGTNAKLGMGEYFVVEADESDASFLQLLPTIVAVTNIDIDHMENFSGDFSKLQDIFIKFLERLPFYGLAVLCIDDPIIRKIIAKVSCQVITYGVSPDADIRMLNFKQEGRKCDFEVINKAQNKTRKFTVNLAGEHNCLNSLAAIAIADELEISDEIINKALTNFAGVGRRFQHVGQYKLTDGVVDVIDDYGHHPREIAATIKAARVCWPDRRLSLLFQPHRYTRTRDLFNDFTETLSLADQVLLLDVYPAGENLIIGATTNDLAESIKKLGKTKLTILGTEQNLQQNIDAFLQKNDILLATGAGSISAMVKRLLVKNAQNKE